MNILSQQLLSLVLILGVTLGCATASQSVFVCGPNPTWTHDPGLRRATVNIECVVDGTDGSVHMIVRNADESISPVAVGGLTAAGALIGTAVAPGPGTVAGAAAGAIADLVTKEEPKQFVPGSKGITPQNMVPWDWDCSRCKGRGLDEN